MADDSTARLPPLPVNEPGTNVRKYAMLSAGANPSAERQVPVGAIPALFHHDNGTGNMAQPQTKYLFMITQFQGDLDRVGTALALANTALAQGSDVLVWLTAEGVNLGKRGVAEGLIPRSLPPIAELLDAFVENGGRVGICPPCGKTHGVTDQNLIPNCQWMGAPVLLAEAQNRQTFSF